MGRARASALAISHRSPPFTPPSPCSSYTWQTFFCNSRALSLSHSWTSARKIVALSPSSQFIFVSFHSIFRSICCFYFVLFLSWFVSTRLHLFLVYSSYISFIYSPFPFCLVFYPFLFCFRFVRKIFFLVCNFFSFPQCWYFGRVCGWKDGNKFACIFTI